MYNCLKRFFVGKKYIKLDENEPYITLQSLLQVGGVISTGGMAKIFLQENEVKVNGELENRRGRKLYTGDEVRLKDQMFVVQ